jgi:HEAT repeat protein
LALKDLSEALSDKNKPGRQEIIEQAMAKELFRAPALFPYFDRALDDPDTGLADYIEQTIIPTIGQPMISFLFSNFYWLDTPGDARRLRLLYRLGCHARQGLLQKALDQPQPHLLAAAIELLGENGREENFILRMADHENELLHKAAYRALAMLNTKRSITKLQKLYRNTPNEELLPILSVIARFEIIDDSVIQGLAQSLRAFLQSNHGTPKEILLKRLQVLAMHLKILINKNINNEQLNEICREISGNREFERRVSFQKKLLTPIANEIYAYCQRKI